MVSRRRLSVAVFTAHALVLSLAPGVAFASAASDDAVHPRPTQQRPVPGRHAIAATPSRLAMPAAATPHPVAAPTPTSAIAELARDGRWSSIGPSGLTIALAHGTVRRVKAEILSQAAVSRLGLHGVVVRLSSADGASARGDVVVSIPTSVLEGVYGPDFAARAQWTELTGCTATRCAASQALPSPRVALASLSKPAVSGAAIDGALKPPTASKSAVVAQVPASSRSELVTPMAATNASNGSGDSSATSLAPASQWTVSPQTGDFDWQYPFRDPPPAAGPKPNLAISYDSNSINGQTGSTNNQPSEVGEGFDLSGVGYIERSYVPCSQAGIANSGDECWKTDNASLSLGGHSGTLVKDTSGSWKLAGDDNTKIEHLTGSTSLCSNGTYDNDCWRVTTTDGTQYYFGRNKLPGWTSATQNTNSAWTVPVCGTATTACSGTATTASPFNTQAWRWNLDYVVDLHGNSESFYYTEESNKYAEKNSTTTSVSYVRGGYLTRIDYGMQAGYELTQQAPDQVTFSYGSRCETGVSGEPSNACTTSPPTSSNAQYWPDVPWNDFNCTATACAGMTSPTFWSAVELTALSTQYLSGSAYTPVDTWKLAQAWPNPGDTTTASLTLASITHAGKVGGTANLPATGFSYAMKPNRVAPPNGVVPLNKPRLVGVSTEAGGQITVNYLDTDCSGSSPATPETNTKRCFPQYWTPPGGSTILDWFRIYPVSSVISDPSTGGSVDLPDQMFYDYSIGTPAYQLDTSPLTKDGQRTWSVFAGYNKVRVEHGDPNDPSTLQTTEYTYFRGMNGEIKDTSGDARSVSLTASDGTTVTDSPWWAGQTFETIIYNGLGGSEVSDTISTPWASNATATSAQLTEKIGTSGTAFTYTPTARYSGNLQTVTYSPLSTGGTRTTETTNSFDSLGRVTKAADLGDTSISSDDRCTVTSYVDNTTAWILDLPDQVNNYAGSCSALPSNPSSSTISDVRTSYDNSAWGTAPTLGDATLSQVANSFSGTTPSWITSSTASYDALGRPLTTSDALSRPTTATYSPAAPAAGSTITSDIGPVAKTVTTDALGFTSTATVTPAWGSTTSTTDVNGHVTTTTFDALGRVTGIWLPDRPKSTNPTATTAYTYFNTAGKPMAVATTTLTPTGSTQTSYQIYDGLGRLRQTQTPAESSTFNATPGAGGSSVSESIYDFAGQLTTQYGPYLITAAPSGALWVPSAYSNIPSSTSTTYDGVGRETADITYAYGQAQWETASAYPGVDRTDTTPPAGGTPTTTYTDARGEQTSLLQWHGTSIGDPSIASTFDETSYAYTGTGRLQSMTNQAAEQWTWQYDARGRVISATDPDTGTTQTTYDNDSEIQSTTDADGATLWYTYDNDGRKTAINLGSASGATLDTWQYDTLSGGKGLLSSATSYSGSTPYIEAITGYDADSRPTGASTTLPAGTLGSGSAAYTYTTSTTYNPDGTVATQAEPAVGGVPAETLTYTYTSLGRMYSLIGAKQYLSQTGYDPATGLIIGQDRDNGTNRLQDTYTYTPGTLRLATAQTTTAAASNNLVANLSYSYDSSGNTTRITNSPSATPTDTQCFQYDYLRRLTSAWTPATSSCSAAPSTSNIGGPARYWQSYTYSSDGNRQSVTNYATTAAGTDERDTYNYPQGPNPSQPNAVASVTHASAPAGSNSYTNTAIDNYLYDADGQTTSDVGGTLSWSSQGQLQNIQQASGGATESRIYDATGNLLIQTDPTNGTTVYIGDTELQVPPNSTTITGQRIYSINGQAVAVRHGSSTLVWLDTDPHGTASLAENYGTGAVTSRYYDPFGNPRGTTPTTWPEDRGYLNKPLDPFSDLTTLGAREYNPSLGRFISVDPLLEKGDPQAINGYAYADNNPVANADPSGECIAGDSGQCITGTSGGDIANHHSQHSIGSATSYGSQNDIPVASPVSTDNSPAQTTYVMYTGVTLVRSNSSAAFGHAYRNSMKQIASSYGNFTANMVAECTAGGASGGQCGGVGWQSALQDLGFAMCDEPGISCDARTSSYSDSIGHMGPVERVEQAAPGWSEWAASDPVDAVEVLGAVGDGPGTVSSFSATARVFHHFTPSSEITQKIVDTGKLLGKANRYTGDKPMVRAWNGPLPEGNSTGVEFTTDVPTMSGTRSSSGPVGHWDANSLGVDIVLMDDVEYAVLPINIIRSR